MNILTHRLFNLSPIFFASSTANRFNTQIMLQEKLSSFIIRNERDQALPFFEASQAQSRHYRINFPALGTVGTVDLLLSTTLELERVPSETELNNSLF